RVAGWVRASRGLGARESRAGARDQAAETPRRPARAHPHRDSHTLTPRLAHAHTATRGHSHRDSRTLTPRLAGASASRALDARELRAGCVRSGDGTGDAVEDVVLAHHQLVDARAVVQL